MTGDVIRAKNSITEVLEVINQEPHLPTEKSNQKYLLYSTAKNFNRDIWHQQDQPSHSHLSNPFERFYSSQPPLTQEALFLLYLTNLDKRNICFMLNLSESHFDQMIAKSEAEIHMRFRISGMELMNHLKLTALPQVDSADDPFPLSQIMAKVKEGRQKKRPYMEGLFFLIFLLFATLLFII